MARLRDFLYLWRYVGKLPTRYANARYVLASLQLDMIFIPSRFDGMSKHIVYEVHIEFYL